MIVADQVPEKYRTVIQEQIDLYDEGRLVEPKDAIPDTPDIPIANPKLWLRIPNVVCVFVDMLGSTRLSADAHDKDTAGAYQLFTGTAVRLFNEFESPYIDVRGDGVFALFNSNQCYRALAAGVTFKTFAKEEFVPRIKKATEVDVGCHIGIDCKTVLVRKLGLKRHGGRTDRQNEVWAGKPVNMAAKLAASTEDNELFVSDRFYDRIPHELARRTCSCNTTIFGNRKPLWSTVDDLEDDGRFDFDTAYCLEGVWCNKHGRESCEGLLALDDRR
jgi:class 3 adenylate cyclase